MNDGSKWQVAENIERLSYLQISKILEVFKDETIYWEDIFGTPITRRLRRDIALGRISDVGTVDWWLHCIQLENYHPAACFGLFETQTASALLEHSIGPNEAKHLKEKLLENSTHYSPEDNSKWAEALISMAVKLGEQSELQDEIATYDEVVRRFGDDPAPALREQVAKALFSKGYRLETVRPLDAIATYDEVVRRFGDDPAPALCELVANALFNKGVILLSLIHI